MQFKLVLAFCGLAAAAPAAKASPQKRVVAALEADIAAISSTLSLVDSEINSFGGTFSEGLTLLTSINWIEGNLTLATTEVKSTGTLSSGDSSTIFGTLSSLASEIQQTLTDIEAKEPVFNNAGFDSIVAGSLTSLKTNALDFVSALEGTIDATYVPQIQAFQTAILSTFNTALADFS